MDPTAENKAPTSGDKKPKLVNFALTAGHTHRGVDCGKGDVIELREDQATRLKAQNKGNVTSEKVTREFE
ncbi:MAG: hypothetical protein OEY11_12265 [Gammaproteobacteria bacterium]|nr:hypothetical protein [Gammaproteobacteria bacterium]